VLAHLGLEVNRLIRVSYGPFQLRELEEGQVEEVRTRVLREQLGERIAELAGVDFSTGADSTERTPRRERDDRPPRATRAPGRERGPRRDRDEAEPAPKPKRRDVIEDRKGRRVLVQRSGDGESSHRPTRKARPYHGKNDRKPKDD
jgi:23S rRNA pseudouridine2605 synthase